METWFRLPLPARVAAIVLGWLVYLALVLKLLPVEVTEKIAPYIGIACAVGAALTAAADHRLHRRFGSVDQLKMYRSALRTGKMPKDADLAEWRRWLRGTEAANALAPLCVAPYLLVGVYSIFGSQNPSRWLQVVAVAVPLLWGVFVLVQRGAGAKHLRAVVKHRAAAVARAAGAPADAQSGTSTREGAFEMSLAGRLLSGCVAWFVGALSVILIVDLEALVFGAPRIMRTEWAVGLAVLMAVVWAVLGEDRDLRRNFASFAEYTVYNQTLRTGEMPPDIEPGVWHSRLKTTRRENVVRLALALFCVAVGIAAIVTDQSVYHWVTATLLQLLAFRFLVNWWAARERLASLTARVQRHAVRQTWG